MEGTRQGRQLVTEEVRNEFLQRALALKFLINSQRKVSETSEMDVGILLQFHSGESWWKK